MKDENLDMLKFHLFEYIFEEEMVDKAIFIQSGFLFDKVEELLKIDNGFGIGFDIYTKTYGYKEIIKPRLTIFRGLREDFKDKSDHKLLFLKEYQNLNLGRVSNYSKWSCSIRVRSELVFSGLLSRPRHDHIKEDDQNCTNVALLVPVKNQNDKIEECPLLNYLIPSILRTTCDSSPFTFTLYVGYDVNDPIFKDQINRDQVKNSTSSCFKVKFYELPKTGWLTFIWNFLFVEAYKDKSEYFIQLNDDVKFLKSGWLNSSISMLPKEAKGVIGFNDITWQCKLYTQALVNRNHYKIFKGQFFPLSLRNWYSDNWITSVYKEGSACNKEALISNSNVKTRYKPCDSLNYKRRILRMKG